MHYEYQGQHYEIDTEDPAVAKQKILAHLGSTESAPAEAPVAPAQEPSAGAAITGTALGATYSPNPTGINSQAVGEAVQPMVQAAKNVGVGYMKNPAQAIVDVGAMHLGMPPPYATMKGASGIYNVYKGVNDTLSNISQATGGLPEEARVPFNKIIDKLNPSQYRELNELIQAKGPGAVNEFKIPTNLAGDTEFVNAVNELKGMAPGLMQKAGMIAGPAMRAAGKVLGPAGLALNAYDAGQMARQTELGSRLAQGQGTMAQHAYRQMPGQINTPANPQPGTPQFAALQQQYSGVPQMPPAPQSPAAPPTSSNFIARIHQLAHTYLPARYQQGQQQ